ncbi:MAG TPA: hypothetical protein VJ251_08320, partial [Stellaceae bacterium]|nr:hypothetical protein [Stellaceae bacterium]
AREEQTSRVVKRQLTTAPYRRNPFDPETDPQLASLELCGLDLARRLHIVEETAASPDREKSQTGFGLTLIEVTRKLWQQHVVAQLWLPRIEQH